MNRSAKSVAVLLLAAVAMSACGPKKGAPSRAEPAGKPPATAAKPPPKGTTPEERFDAALQLMKSNKTKEAEAAMVALAKEFPKFSGPATNVGILYTKSGRRDAAIQWLQRAVELNPNNVVALNWLGIAQKGNGNAPAAEAAWNKALRVKPDYAAAHFNLGLLYADVMNDPGSALESFAAYRKIVGDKDLRPLVWSAELEGKRPKVVREPVAQEPKT